MEINFVADGTQFESERPVIFYLEEIEQATNNFDEKRIIGKGGYGSVYYGKLGEKVYTNPIKIIMILINNSSIPNNNLTFRRLL